MVPAVAAAPPRAAFGLVARGLAPQVGSPGTVPGVSEKEIKAELIKEVLDLQNTLDVLSERVDHVKGDNHKLQDENKMLTLYIENLQSKLPS